jgi:hypothetical protein
MPPMPPPPRTLATLAALVALVAGLLGPSGARAQVAGPAAAAAPAGSAAAGPGLLHIHVRGGAELHAVASAEHGELTFHGQLVDDAGTPIPHAPVVVQASSSEGAAGARSPLRVGPLRPCDAAGARPPPHGGPDEAVVETDDRGEFCAVGHGAAPAMTLELRFRGSKLYDAADLSVPVDPEPRLLRTILRFEPPPEAIDLDRESVTVTASLHVERNDARGAGGSGAAPPLATAQRANLALTLVDERGAHVADALTGGDGRARFEVKTAALAGPGSGELRVRFAGNAVLTKAEWSQPLVRRAEAHLALTHPIERADAEDGLTLDVDVATARGAVAGGVVEVRRVGATGAMGGRPAVDSGSAPSPGGALGETVGAGDVDEHGHARIVATFSAGGATLVPLSLRFVPAAPWYRPGPELRVEARLAEPGVGRQILLAAAVVAAAAWVVVGWRRSPRPPVLPGLEGAKAPPSGRAGVHVLASPADLAGWRGTVTDAHDGSPIAGAHLSIVAPAFAGDGVVVRVVADERGAFTLDAPYRSDARLVVSAAEHSVHEQALPPPSVLGVALITRRRAVLERLVRWARQRGAPFDGAPEPTPGHVRRVAARSSAPEVEAWASRVEQTAFGPDRVDEGLEREVRSAEPRAAR